MGLLRGRASRLGLTGMAALVGVTLLGAPDRAAATFPGPIGLLTYTTDNTRFYDAADPSTSLSGPSQLQLIAPDGSGRRALTANGFPHLLARWSPDGRHLVYTGQRPPEPGRNVDRLYILDVLTGVEREVPCSYCGHPSWTADGQRLLVSRWTPSSNEYAIDSIALDGSDARLVIRGSSDAVPRAPVMSSDGRHIAFVLGTQLRDHPNSVWVVDADGSNPRRLGLGSAPDFSPDARRLAYLREEASDRPSTPPRIALSNLDGTQQGLLVSDPTLRPDDPTWSPDGSHIAFRASVLDRDYLGKGVILAVKAPSTVGPGQPPGPNSPGCVHGYRLIVAGDVQRPAWGPAGSVGAAAGHPAAAPCPRALPQATTRRSPGLRVRTVVRAGRLQVRTTVGAGAQGRLVVKVRQHGRALRRHGRLGNRRTRTYRYAVRRRGIATVNVRFEGKGAWASVAAKQRRVKVRPRRAGR